MNNSKVEKISSSVYRATNLKIALEQAQTLSELEKDLFSVIESYSETLRSKAFFIERGSPLVLSWETLHAEFIDGVKQ